MLHVAVALSLLVPSLPVPIPVEPLVTVVDDTRGPSRERYRVPADAQPRGRAAVQAKATPPVGTVRSWLGLDDADGSYYRKNYTLRGSGRYIEVWVADNLAFPAGDCRSGDATVTDAQVAALVHEFDTVIYPEETAAFSTPPDRDGTDPVVGGDFTGDGDKTVTLVDNVRDSNFYDFPATATYISGFFSEQLNDLFDRNVMTVDAYDWKHRSGANPPDEPTGEACTSRPARPRMYEGTFAHEWQHLLQHYTDPDEELWVNEGLSDYAQTLVGYADPAKTIHHRGADPHLTCFQGFATVRTAANTVPRDCGGPQNSLNLWNEGAPAEVLADYGNAYQFMLYLKDRYGPDVLTALHRDGARQGMAAVAAVLPDELTGVLHDYQTMTLVDKAIGTGDKRFSAASLRSAVNLDNPAAYDMAGAAPNGADYIRLPVRGKDLRSVQFTGAKTLRPLPLGWTAAADTLFSGNRSNTDATAVVVVTVPEADPVLRFDSRYGAEAGYDFGYVTVSVDGGRTYTAIKGNQTIEGPLGEGITGNTGGKLFPHTYDLSAYAGQKVLLGFRYVSDKTGNDGGWSIKDIAVGDRRIGASLDVFRSPTEIVPTPVHAWNVRLVGLAGRSTKQVPYEQWPQLKGFKKVVAIVSYDEPTGQFEQYAPYQLTINGVRLPGGSATMP